MGVKKIQFYADEHVGAQLSHNKNCMKISTAFTACQTVKKTKLPRGHIKKFPTFNSSDNKAPWKSSRACAKLFCK